MPVEAGQPRVIMLGYREVMKKSLIFPVLLSLAVGAMALPCGAQEQIIPKVACVEKGAKMALQLQGGSRLLLDLSHPALKAQAEEIAAQLRQGTGLALPLCDVATAPPAGPQDITLIWDESYAPTIEGAYCLSADEQGIVMRAANAAGLYYAFVSLSQMLPVEFHNVKADKSAVQWAVSDAAFCVEDYPRFSWRSFMLDDARYFYGVAEVKRLLDQMALLKMNVFHWGLSNDDGWRIEIQKYPRLCSVGSMRGASELGRWGSGKSDGKPHGGYYTQDEVKDIVAYAAARHITVVPEINGPSHSAAAIVAYPQLSLRPVSEVPITFGRKAALDPTSEFTYQFLSDVYDEILALFPSPIIHTGGDEVRYGKEWKGQEAIEAFMKDKNLETLADVQIYYSNRVSSILKEKGRRMMGWNEILGSSVHNFGGGEALGELDPHVVVHFWKGSLDMARDAIRRGYTIVNSHCKECYLDYSYKRIPLATAYQFDPVLSGLTAEEAKSVLGSACAMWTQWTPTGADMEYMSFPRTVAYAEGGWTPLEKKDYADFLKRLKVYSHRMDVMGINYAKDVETAAPAEE